MKPTFSRSIRLRVKEEVLHQVWKFCLVNNLNCFTTDGERIQILSPGIHNTSDSGPDFSTAKIKIGKTLWVGNVEIHFRSSDWTVHGHHSDPSYSNVVLHVVYEDDGVDLPYSPSIPVLELKKNVVSDVWEKIEKISSKKSLKLCHENLIEIKSLEWIAWQDRLLTERYERKVKEVELLYQLSSKNWEQVCFQLLAKCLGGTVNKEPFLIFSKQLNIFFLKKHTDSLIAIESILFGFSGMLEGKFRDLYPQKLKQEYIFYKEKYRLKGLDSFWWKWLRLRPSSFPTIQLGLLASLIFNLKNLTIIFESESYEVFKALMVENSTLSPYWENHYKFDKPTKEKNKNWGEGMLKRIFINAVLPYQISKSKQMGQYDCSIYLEKLSAIKEEDNKIIREWKLLKAPVSSSYESQAMLQLTNEYCSRKKCLNCNIGLRILKYSNK